MKVDAYFDNIALPHIWFALIYDDTHPPHRLYGA